MSCRRVRREILEIVRFGEIGPGSSPHLEHLSRCSACRDEVGLDRALVAQLRRALAARVDPVTPPSRAWSAILRETQRPAPRPPVWTWSTGLVGRLRTATTMAGTGLALLLALNMEVIPASAPAPAAAAPERVTLQQVPRMPTGRTTLVALANLANERGAAAAARPDPERALIRADARVAPRPGIETDVEPQPASDEQDTGQTVLLVRPLQTPERDDGHAPPAASAPDDGEDGEAVDSAPGEPS